MSCVTAAPRCCPRCVVLPALIYVAVVGGGEAGRGWGLPMATDIAFAVGILALLGRRTSTGAKAASAQKLLSFRS
ncbi:Na+/H+ antiporter NhaA [Streptomyces sp. NPDC057433]|uniref:Na+/H+ antiporter NhaA n=1 Tax=Streptomyces sp. NPDC057433 TaxID=3346132 RepID=UPI0036B6CCC6